MDFWQTITEIPEGRRYVRYAAYGIGGGIIFGGLYLVGRKTLRNAFANHAEKKSFKEGTPETFAKQFKMAFENNGMPGTNVELVRQLFRQMPNKAFFVQVVKAYKTLFTGDNLVRDLSDELTDTEYSEMLNILEGVNPFALARRLKAAFDYKFWGMPMTDDAALRAVLVEVPSKAVWAQVEQAYESLYARHLMTDLTAELEWWEKDTYLQIIANKPQ